MEWYLRVRECDVESIGVALEESSVVRVCSAWGFFENIVILAGTSSSGMGTGSGQRCSDN